MAAHHQGMKAGRSVLRMSLAAVRGFHSKYIRFYTGVQAEIKKVLYRIFNDVYTQIQDEPKTTCPPNGAEDRAGIFRIFGSSIDF